METIPEHGEEHRDGNNNGLNNANTHNLLKRNRGGKVRVQKDHNSAIQTLKDQVDTYYNITIKNLKDTVPQVVDRYLIYEAGENVRKDFSMNMSRLHTLEEGSKDFLGLDDEIEEKRKDLISDKKYLEESIKEL